MRFFLDTCVMIYLVEGEPAFSTAVVAAMRNASPSLFCFNDLVHLECLVEPLKTRDDALTSVYDAQLDALKTLAMDREVFLRAADMCAQSSLETPDALHLATAIHHRRDVFRTGNARLAGLRVPLEFRVFSG